MNKFLYLLIILCLVIASCNDEHNDEKPDAKIPFWENSHLAFFGLKGSVSRVVESTYSFDKGSEIEEENVIFDMRFNSAGQITYYNPTGGEPLSRDVWQTVACYSYEYDGNGRLIKATVTPLGDDPLVYTLNYGEHTNYVPLIFPLGKMEFFLVKGLQSITSEDGSISYIYDDGKAAYEEETWSGNIETEYLYESGSSYPAKKVVTISRGVTVMSEESTMYTYDTEGRLLTQDDRTIEDGIESVRTITRYAEGQLLLPVVKKMDMGATIFDWIYTYDSKNCLQRVQYIENEGSEDEITDKEEYTYLSYDTYGNWTDSRQLQSSVVDWSHTDGTVGVRRNFTY
ncbi:hypothetical protein [uncultured Bacteroides sp.]|uniref:hypothetical protein n=1 Tax=uncultured Bacteroides sp. TaxID=162156 RepID=UPI0025E7BF2F|nr:hypothetical protein [uncultured Bacteroides sp.]